MIAQEGNGHSVGNTTSSCDELEPLQHGMYLPYFERVPDLQDFGNQMTIVKIKAAAMLLVLAVAILFAGIAEARRQGCCCTPGAVSTESECDTGLGCFAYGSGQYQCQQGADGTVRLSNQCDTGC